MLNLWCRVDLCLWLSGKAKRKLDCVRGYQHCIALCWAWTICTTSIGWRLLLFSNSPTPSCVGKQVFNILCVDTRFTHITLWLQHNIAFCVEAWKKWKIVLCGVLSVLSVKKVSFHWWDAISFCLCRLLFAVLSEIRFCRKNIFSFRTIEV